MKRIFFATLLFVMLQLLLCNSASLPSGYVISWGVNLNSQRPVIPASNYFSTNIVRIGTEDLVDAISISAGGDHGLALRNNGTVVAWGNSSKGAAIGYETPHLADGLVKLQGKMLSNIVAVAASCNYNQQAFSLALRKDGTVVGWGGATMLVKARHRLV